MKSQRFEGPLFIVGMPRSGTKLLRDLLNRHSRVSVPRIESLFIPSLARRYAKVSFSDDASLLTECLDAVWKSPFIWYLSREAGIDVDRDKFESALRADKENPASLSELMEFVFRYFSEKGFRDKSVIWGDKSPCYVRHMRPLKNLFSSGKFIHIIRDPRDYALSMKRTWNKNIYRAAAGWRETVSDARRDAVALGDSYVEVQYEKLLSNPVAAMTALCDFVGVPFEDNCVKLDKSSESYGDARGKCYIDVRNTNKYRAHLKKHAITRIEQICLPIMRELGYSPDYATVHRPLSRTTRCLYKLVDGFHLGLFRVRQYGVCKGISLCGRLLRANSDFAKSKAT